MKREDLFELLNSFMEKDLISESSLNKIFSKIKRADAERMINLFDILFDDKYNTKIKINPQLMTVLKNRGEDLNIFFIGNNSHQGLSFVYKINDDYFQLNDVQKETVEAKFVDYFIDFQLNHQHNLNTKRNPDQLGCPNAVTVPFLNINEFDDSIFSHAEIITSVYDMIGSSDSRRDNRVSIILKYVAKSGDPDEDLFFDTFDPRP